MKLLFHRYIAVVFRLREHDACYEKASPLSSYAAFLCYLNIRILIITKQLFFV